MKLPILNFGLPKLGFGIPNMIWITNIRFRKAEVRGHRLFALIKVFRSYSSKKLNSFLAHCLHSNHKVQILSSLIKKVEKKNV